MSFVIRFSARFNAHARIGSGFALDDSCYGDAEPKSPIMFASFIVNANHSIV